MSEERNTQFFKLLHNARLAHDRCVSALENYPDELPEAQESRDLADQQLAKFLIAHTNTISIAFGDAPLMPAQVHIEALKAARHELTTLHGLYAHDGDPERGINIETDATVAIIDAALDDLSKSAPYDEYIKFCIEDDLAQNAKLAAQMEDYRKRLPNATPEERELLNIAISGCLAALNALDEKIGRAVVALFTSR